MAEDVDHALIDQEIKWRLEHQLVEFDGVDSKATTVLGATGVVFGLVLNGVGIFDPAVPAPRVLFYISLVILAIGLCVGVRNLWPRVHQVVPAPKAFLETYRTKSRSDTLQELAATRCLAFEMNTPVLREKALLLRVQMLFLASAGAILALAYIWRATY